ncbi:class I SAM-dependent methyltransferase [Hymenobacter weizhouensis]|uniref:class I SAM-dependent methyltransferase n=1 Tax=Hymenobacter sp. YIM 151500-1 TaxID=2987689 RepID=UPI002225BC50|nr:class I SAM-dependent methyltransferase [Hymenobacter sp. YIM 151500-1]UYZ64555.1 class I SAM-dependent methyltransferase [Hymenobacter sp. YIM 151500-1]
MQTPRNIIDCYDKTAQRYAAEFRHELDHKHFDRLVLRAFAQENATRGPVLDLGCGPGHTTAFLAACGLPDVLGLDISPEMVKQARLEHPQLRFTTGDILHLAFADSSVGAAIAFYSLIHFEPAQLHVALSEIRRVLQPGGQLLFSFHIGAEIVHRDEFLGEVVSIDFRFMLPDAVVPLLRETGFAVLDVLERHPYPDVEYPSRRAYVWVAKPAGD